MITIRCNKCGDASDNRYHFNDKSFHYIDKNGYVIYIHLCRNCQMQLIKEKNKAIAEFLKVDSVSDFKEGNLL